MFTGLIEDVGVLVARRALGGAARLTVQTGLPLAEIRVGDSVAVNGACLTVEALEPGARRLAFHCLHETLSRTNLGSLAPGTPVNLERALRLGDRLGGHLVAGHVDATAPLLAIQRRSDDIEVTIASPDDLQELLVPKGSIAVNGISLTLAALHETAFAVRLIPHTWTHTNLAALEPGALVNLEGDLVGKFVLRREARQAAKGGAVTEATLGRAGFLD